MIFLLVFCGVHLLIPLRHHYFPGDVAWTEEGHRFSWRMMLRSKRGYGNFKVINQATGEIKVINTKETLSKRQHQKLYTHPDMILQYAHYLRDRALAEKGEQIQVFANIMVRLNGRKYHRFINDTVDLAKIEWSYFRAADWILPEQ